MPESRPYHSWDLQTNGEPVNRDLPPPQPEILAAPDVIIEIGPDGIAPALIMAPPGTLVKWVNTDIGDHTVRSIAPMQAGPGISGSGGWNSIRLFSGESFTVQLKDEGSYNYVDDANPTVAAQIEVRSIHPITLPLIDKR